MSASESAQTLHAIAQGIPVEQSQLVYHSFMDTAGRIAAALGEEHQQLAALTNLASACNDKAEELAGMIIALQDQIEAAAVRMVQ